MGAFVAKKLSYSDAVKLLGGKDGRAVAAADRAVSSLIQGVVPGSTDVLNWFGAKIEFVRLGRGLVRNLYENRTGLSRYDRTQRIEAAHAVIVIVAYFEALERAQLPFRFQDLQLSRAEQLSMSTVPATPSGPTALVQSLVSTGIPRLSAECGREEFRTELLGFYSNISAAVVRFLEGLSVWESLSESERSTCRHVFDA